MRKYTKLYSNAKLKSLDRENRIAEYIISSDVKDRMEEIVEQSWQLENYRANPIVLWGHNPSIAQNVLGKCIEIRQYSEDGVNYTAGKVQFAKEGTHENVDTVWSLVEQDILRTVSVGFIPHTFKTISSDDDGREDTTVLADNELLEFSIVPIPANPTAVALAYGDGSISDKDARWLLKNYKEEAGYIEKELYGTIKKTNATDTTTKSEVLNMNEEQIKELAGAISKGISEALEPELKAIKEAVEATKQEDEGATGAGDGAATDNGDGAKTDDTKNDDAKTDEDDAAKSEQDDEDGADNSDEDAEIDETEELDEEGEKSFVAQLEKEYSTQKGS